MNFHNASITTPVNGNRLWNFLQGYPHQAAVSHGFLHGFAIGINTPNNVQFNKFKLCRRPDLNRAVVIEKLNCELEAGRILGPYPSTQLPGFVFSPLYAIPKSQPGKYRLIHNLSHPKASSINDNIPDNLKHVQYCSIMDVAAFLDESRRAGGPLYYLAKIDLADAYRNVPIRKEDWKYLGMQFEDKFFSQHIV